MISAGPCTKRKTQECEDLKEEDSKHRDSAGGTDWQVMHGDGRDGQGQVQVTLASNESQ